jgi:dolichol-phosphate mannosyltransferase
MSEVLIGISTYNEIENLPNLIEQIDEHFPSAHILIVDDNSPDGTGEWSERQADERENFFCIRREGKLGLGTATITTLQYAIDHDYTFVVNMDADLSHPPKYLPALIEAAKTGHAGSDQTHQPADVAVGSRYVQGGGIVGWPLHRKIMSRCVNGYARLALGLPTRDCSGSFRCYRVSKLRDIALDRVRSRGYSFFEEILWHLRHAGARFVEVPITFVDREKGQSKINMREAINALRIIGSLAFDRP